MTDFVAACGGILGLFLGISLLSIVELVYYFSLRLFCSYRLKNAEKNTVQVDLENGVDQKKQPITFVRSSNFYW